MLRKFSHNTAFQSFIMNEYRIFLGTYFESIEMKIFLKFVNVNYVVFFHIKPILHFSGTLKLVMLFSDWFVVIVC